MHTHIYINTWVWDAQFSRVLHKQTTALYLVHAIIRFIIFAFQNNSRLRLEKKTKQLIWKKINFHYLGLSTNYLLSLCYYRQWYIQIQLHIQLFYVQFMALAKLMMSQSCAQQESDVVPKKASATAVLGVFFYMFPWEFWKTKNCIRLLKNRSFKGIFNIF